MPSAFVQVTDPKCVSVSAPMKSEGQVFKVYRSGMKRLFGGLRQYKAIEVRG